MCALEPGCLPNTYNNHTWLIHPLVNNTMMHGYKLTAHKQTTILHVCKSSLHKNLLKILGRISRNCIHCLLPFANILWSGPFMNTNSPFSYGSLNHQYSAASANNHRNSYYIYRAWQFWLNKNRCQVYCYYYSTHS